jgi:putative ABC transport system substrate-binding protein
MKRRAFIALLGGAAGWPLAARAQQRPRDSVVQSSPRTYRLGTLTGNVPLSANSPEGTTLLNALAQRGYTLGRNLAYDARGAGGELAKIPQLIEDFRAGGAGLPE